LINMPRKQHPCRRIEKVKLFQETHDIYWSEDVQQYIQSQVMHPNKMWVQHIIHERKERDQVKMKNKDFILLPDTKDIYQKMFFVRKPHNCFNWMIITTDPELRNIRDLRQEHIALLNEIKNLSVARLQQDFPDVQKEDIMIYANYPPSVQQLHFHLCCPFFSSSAYDAFRIHPIEQIINNLTVHPDYYRVSNFIIPVHEFSPLLKVYLKSKAETESDKECICES
jgi:hypothetical protein